MLSSPLSRSSCSLAFACDSMFRIKFSIFTIGEIKYTFFIRMSCKACMAKNAPILFATIVTDLRLLRIDSKYGANSSFASHGVRAS